MRYAGSALRAFGCEPENEEGLKMTARGRLTQVFVGAGLAAGIFADSAHAAKALHATQDVSQTSVFTLDFGDFGVSDSNITVTQFNLSVDAAGGTARFANYFQHVDALTLPGGFSTGAITVSVVPGSSQGTFDPVSGEIRTSEFYRIDFSGDLSAFGLTSPVFLPGTSVGTVNFDDPNSGDIELTWDGIGQLANPDPRGAPIVFRYQCRTNTQFSAPKFGDLNCDGEIDFFDIDPFVEALVNPLGFVADRPQCPVNNADINADGTINPFDVQPFLDMIGG